MARSRKAKDKPAAGKRRIEQYDHTGQQRKNNPPVGLVTEATDRDAPHPRHGGHAALAHGPPLGDRHPEVIAWAKNDHLGFEVVYVFDGVVRKYRPDFLVKLKTGTSLVLEVKGQDSPQNQAKRAALDEWTRAVTAHGGFGHWRWAVSSRPSDIVDLVCAAAQ